MNKNMIYPSASSRDKIFARLQSENPKDDLSFLKILSRTLLFSAKISQALEHHFQRYELSQPGFSTLMTLYSEPEKEWTAIELARELQVKPPTMTGILDTLEKGGYILRIASEEDRRKLHLRLSPQGKAKLKKILPDHISRLKSAFSHLKKQFAKEQEKVFAELEISLQKLTEGVAR